jgi:hypothetical protein
VRVTPIAVEVPSLAGAAPRTGVQRELIFLGSLDYFPNRESVIEFDQSIAPALVREGIADVALDVVGTASARAGTGLSERVRLLGYSDDLADVLRGYKAMLMTRGLKGGIKTKAIHAAANGVIILTHPDAIEGTNLTHDSTALVWRNAEELAAHIRRIRAGDPRLAEIVDHARQWARENYSADVARKWWSDSLATAIISHADRRARGGQPAA